MAFGVVDVNTGDASASSSSIKSLTNRGHALGLTDLGDEGFNFLSFRGLADKGD